MVENTRHIEVEGGYNIRDLGGYPTEDGQYTRWRVLVRAGNLDRITPAGQQQLADYGIKTIVDLRDPTEVQQFPNVFVQSGAVAYLNLPLSPGGFAIGTSYAVLEALYCKYLSDCQTNIGAIIAAVVDSAPGIVVHCHVGKDRTGMVSALLLGAVGVPDDVIAQDYALTSQRISHLIAGWREYALRQGYPMQYFERDIGSQAATMLATLDFLRSRYGSIADYLHTCGVTDAQLARLQTLLVSPERA